MQKAYDKSRNEFLALKKFKTVLENDNDLEVIMREDELLQHVEQIRANGPNCNEYFLKYDGVVRDPNDESTLILKMESGCATLENILDASPTGMSKPKTSFCLKTPLPKGDFYTKSQILE